MMYLWVSISMTRNGRKNIYQDNILISDLIGYCNTIVNINLYYRCHGHQKIHYNFKILIERVKDKYTRNIPILIIY
jgi:hypothetical protein